MSLLGLSSQQDYNNLAEKLRTYEGAEQFTIDQLAPVVNGVYQFFYPTVFLAFVLIGLIWWALRLAPVQGMRYLLTVAFVSALMLPVEIGGAQVPASFYYFNWLTTQGLGAMQTVIDGTFRTPGGAGNYAAALHSLSPYSSGASGDDLRGTDLARVVKDYGDACGRAAVGELTVAEMQAVGLAGGALGVVVPGTEKARVGALQKLKGKTAGWGVPPTEQHEHYYIRSRSWWLGREVDKNQVPQYLTNDIADLQYICSDGTRCETDKARFVARDCADLWLIADMAAREYQAAIAARSKFAAQRAGIAPGEDKDGLVVLGAQITAAQKVNAAGVEAEKPKSLGQSIAGAILDGLESLVVTFAMKFVNWFAEIVTKWFVFAIPAVGALGVGLMFVAWPLVVGMALIPGRESSIPEFLYYNVFIKLFLFFAYAILKVGGALFLAAVDQFARDGSSSLASMTFISGLVIMIGATYGAATLANAVTFSKARGMVGALGLGALGAQQISQTARTLTTRGVNLISSRPAPGAAARGNLKPHAGRGTAPPGQVKGSAAGAGRGTTLKGVRDQVSGKKQPPSIG